MLGIKSPEHLDIFVLGALQYQQTYCWFFVRTRFLLVHDGNPFWLVYTKSDLKLEEWTQEILADAAHTATWLIAQKHSCSRPASRRKMATNSRRKSPSRSPAHYGLAIHDLEVDRAVEKCYSFDDGCCCVWLKCGKYGHKCSTLTREAQQRTPRCKQDCTAC